MQPTIDQIQADANKINAVGLVNYALGLIKRQAEINEDGNTSALVNRITRDLAALDQKYHVIDHEAQVEHDRAQERPVSEQDPAFIEQSYQKTAAKDVNQAPYPNTGEDASAPFVTKGAVKGEALKNADSEEEGSTGRESRTVGKTKLST